MFRSLLLYFALLLWFVVPSQAQPTIIAPTLTAEPGQTINIPIQMEGIDSMTSLQFSINWDKTVLSFLQVSNYNMPYLGDSNFGPASEAIETGKMRVLWFDGSSQVSGISLEDGTAIFQISFQVIGNWEDESSILFTNDPIDIEITQGDSILTLVTQPGLVSLTDPNSTHETSTISTFNNYPNPFTEYTQLRFSLKEGGTAKITIYDVNGHQVYRQESYYSPGEHLARIYKTTFSDAGIYYCNLEFLGQRLAKKMFFVR